ncbi:MAG: outer membrane beta-barrel protein [Spirochaetota bacterium]
MNPKVKSRKENISHYSILYALCAMRYTFCAMLSAVFIYSPVANADVGDFFSKFHPHLTVQEEYNDNIYLTNNDRKSDFITTIYPGLRFSTLPARVTTPGQILQTPEDPAGIDLDYRLGLLYYARETQNDYISHEGTLNTWYTFDRRLTLRLRNVFIQSEELRERDYTSGALEEEFLLGRRTERGKYLRNVFEPSAEYRFGVDDIFSLNYRNNIYRNKIDRSQDSQEDFINPRLSYWFNIRNGVTLEYALTLGEFESSSNFIGHMGRGRYTYRFNPRTSTFVEYTFTRRDFDPPSSDYDIYNPSIGVEHAFSPTLTGRVQVGYFWHNPEIGSSTGSLSYDAGLTQRAERTTYTLIFQGGYTEDYFTAENLGFTKYHRAIASISHHPYQRVNLRISGTLERAEYESDRKDWIYGVNGGASFEIFRWLSLSMEASHRRNDSNVDNMEYIENRIIFRLSATI